MHIELFGFSVYPYGILCCLAALGMLCGLRFLCKRTDAGFITFLIVLLGLIGARLLFCAVHLSDYIESYENPWLMLRFFDGGFSMTGLIGGCILGCFLAAVLEKNDFAAILDDVALILPFSIALLRIGESFTELGIGKSVRSGTVTEAFSWLFVKSQMGKAVEYRMNIRVYETIVALVIFIVLLCFAKQHSGQKGKTAALFFLLYGSTQTVLDSLRDDGHMMLLFLRIGQLGAVIMLITTFCFLLCKSHRLKKAGTGDMVLRCIAMLIGIGLCVAIEFSLDGRLTIGKPTLGRDYAILGAVCLGMLLVGLHTLSETIPVHGKETLS